ncbi:hypothetical protein D3C85_1591690 [compost metagenome]
MNVDDVAIGGVEVMKLDHHIGAAGQQPRLRVGLQQGHRLGDAAGLVVAGDIKHGVAPPLRPR